MNWEMQGGVGGGGKVGQNSMDNRSTHHFSPTFGVQLLCRCHSSAYHGPRPLIDNAMNSKNAKIVGPNPMIKPRINSVKANQSPCQNHGCTFSGRDSWILLRAPRLSPVNWADADPKLTPPSPSPPSGRADRVKLEALVGGCNLPWSLLLVFMTLWMVVAWYPRLGAGSGCCW